MHIKNNKKISIIVAMLMIGSTFVGCAKDKKESATTSEPKKNEQSVKLSTKDDYTYESNDYFTSISWLEKNIEKNKNLVIIDARSEEDYKKGHIPGSINVAWQSLAQMEGKAGDKNWGTLLEKDALSKALSEIGITKDSQVLVYATKGAWGEDGRIVWCLQRAGVDARMLNGGFDLWKSENKEVSKDISKNEVSDFKVEKITNHNNITTDELKKEIKDVKLIDTREEDEYKGATNFGEARGGHLPNAINITFNKLYNEDGTIKSNEEIEKVMKENKIEKTDKIVTYCTAGIRSAHMGLALKNAGYENVRNYDASYYEWAADKNNEIVK
ncbi:rhodanese-like domain-containing protein [Romboutsia sedimentorum]|uniref:thiosulfate sulfurtransferase n=1 Tax=Romboutsia sedimentorum TaxID=1368474 RepID=A0ABT7EAX1_9FIRM|nr:rhodanese-like domain-containing protein [Romboutsia sedimentorum]MDK2564077.1 rhodanese-like domain-containing protein [Romboutsia sedimentorum]